MSLRSAMLFFGAALLGLAASAEANNWVMRLKEGTDPTVVAEDFGLEYERAHKGTSRVFLDSAAFPLARCRCPWTFADRDARCLLLCTAL